MTLVGSRQAARGRGQGLLPGTVSYLRGRDPPRWLTRLPTYAAVRYASVYPGVGLVYYGNHGRLEYDFQVAPGADPRQVRWAISGGALALAPNGDLILRTTAGELRQRRPAVYQLVAGARRDANIRDF